MHSLETVAENAEVEICATLNGATFENHMHHITCGMKVIDVRVIYPKQTICHLNIKAESFLFFECHLMKDTKEGCAFLRFF